MGVPASCECCQPAAGGDAWIHDRQRSPLCRGDSTRRSWGANGETDPSVRVGPGSSVMQVRKAVLRAAGAAMVACAIAPWLGSGSASAVDRAGADTFLKA